MCSPGLLVSSVTSFSAALDVPGLDPRAAFLAQFEDRFQILLERRVDARGHAVSLPVSLPQRPGSLGPETRYILTCHKRDISCSSVERTVEMGDGRVIIDLEHVG